MIKSVFYQKEFFDGRFPHRLPTLVEFSPARKKLYYLSESMLVTLIPFESAISFLTFLVPKFFR